MNILINLKNLVISPRFVTWYINVGFVALATFLDMIVENLAGIGLPEWSVIMVGLLMAQVSKGLRNRAEGKSMGFAK